MLNCAAKTGGEGGQRECGLPASVERHRHEGATGGGSSIAARVHARSARLTSSQSAVVANEGQLGSARRQGYQAPGSNNGKDAYAYGRSDAASPRRATCALAGRRVLASEEWRRRLARGRIRRGLHDGGRVWKAHVRPPTPPRVRPAVLASPVLRRGRARDLILRADVVRRCRGCAWIA